MVNVSLSKGVTRYCITQTIRHTLHDSHCQPQIVFHLARANSSIGIHCNALQVSAFSRLVHRVFKFLVTGHIILPPTSIYRKLWAYLPI